MIELFAVNTSYTFPVQFANAVSMQAVKSLVTKSRFTSCTSPLISQWVSEQRYIVPTALIHFFNYFDNSPTYFLFHKSPNDGIQLNRIKCFFVFDEEKAKGSLLLPCAPMQLYQSENTIHRAVIPSKFSLLLQLLSSRLMTLLSLQGCVLHFTDQH